MSDATITTLKLEQLQSSKTNPRRSFAGEAMQELQESVKRHGILQPILVRPSDGRYEIVAGERRFRAAKAAGLGSIPVTVRELTDQDALEIQVIENLQRQDLHPLEEADGYQALLRVKSYDAAKIAERVGRSVKYVYDRIKLLQLIEPVRKVFLAGEIAAGHAILLARLTPTDQKRSLEGDGDSGRGLFQADRGLWDEGGRKACSVRELEQWIENHVRFDPQQTDAFLFPETAKTVKQATEEAEKVIHITHDHYVQPEARTTQRVFGPQSWKKATGKGCAHAVTGVIVVGEGRGQAFRVCVNKEKCAVHWGQWQKERATRAKQSVKDGGTATQRYEKDQERRKAQEAKEAAERKRWEQALPKILEAVAAAVKKAPTRSAGFLAELILDTCISKYETPKDACQGKYLTRGTTAEDLVRYVGFLILATAAHEYAAAEEFPQKAKALGIDVKKILDAAAPADPNVQTSGKTTPAKKVEKS